MSMAAGGAAEEHSPLLGIISRTTTLSTGKMSKMRLLFSLSTLTMALAKVGSTIQGGQNKPPILSLTGGGTTNAVTVEHRHGHHHQGHGQPRHSESSPSHENNGISSENFDFYVYSMSYQPEFCRENNEKFVGCHAFDESWEGQLTIHGLWPNNNDGTYPSTCTDEQLDISLLQNLYDSLAKKWPNVKAVSASSPEHDAFWAHEWSKHGTCSGLSQFDYFSAALGLLVPTPAVVKERYGSGGGEVTRQELEEGYAYHGYDNISASIGGEGVGAAILVCKSGYLSEVRVCYEKKTNGGAVGGVGERIRCPASVVREDTCGDDIKIASFDSITTISASAIE